MFMLTILSLYVLLMVTLAYFRQGSSENSDKKKHINTNRCRSVERELEKFFDEKNFGFSKSEEDSKATFYTSIRLNSCSVQVSIPVYKKGKSVFIDFDMRLPARVPRSRHAGIHEYTGLLNKDHTYIHAYLDSRDSYVSFSSNLNMKDAGAFSIWEFEQRLNECFELSSIHFEGIMEVVYARKRPADVLARQQENILPEWN